MSLTTVVDRSGVRWIKFNCVYTRVTGSTSKNASRDLRDKVKIEHVREYQQLDLDDDDVWRPKGEHIKSKYVNDDGVLEYLGSCNGQKETTEGILRELKLTLPAPSTNRDREAVVYQNSIKFHEDDIHIEDTFCMLNVFGKIWIEASKLCRFFDYANPWQAIQNHITDENKSTAVDLLKMTIPHGTSEVEAALESLLGNLSPDLLFINEAGLWQLSQHSRKPMLKRFWTNMCKTLSERYNMVFDVQQDEVFAVPKPSTDGGEPMDVDDQNYKVRMLEAQLRAKDLELELSKVTNDLEMKRVEEINNLERKRVKETNDLKLKYAKENNDLELRLTREQCKAREFRAMFMYGIERSDVVDAALLDQFTETAVERSNRESVARALRSPEYTVAHSISDVNPSKETVIAFIWQRYRNTYSAVCQIRESFDRQYRFVKLDAQDPVKHRTTARVRSVTMLRNAC